MSDESKTPAGSGKERRKSKRFQIGMDVEYRTLTQNPIYGNVLSQDISKGGLSFLSKHSLKKGTSVELKMNVPGDNLPVFATGTVAWADGLKAGVKLAKIAKKDQEKILEFIYREWLEHSQSGKDKKR